MPKQPKTTESETGKAQQAARETGIANRIEAARRKLGITQVELHRRSTLARTVIAGYEAGTYIPGGRELLKLCDALRVTPNQLLYGSETPFASSGKGPLSEFLSSNNTLALTTGVTILLQALDPPVREAVITMVEAIYEAKNGPEKTEAMRDMIKALLPSMQDEAMYAGLVDKVAGDPVLKKTLRNVTRRLAHVDDKSAPKKRTRK